MNSINWRSLVKWILKSLLFLSAIGLVTLLSNGLKTSVGYIVLVIFTGAMLLGSFMFFIEFYVFPYRKKALNKRMVKLFSASPSELSDWQFLIEDVWIYIEVSHSIRLSETAMAGEIIRFHMLTDPSERNLGFGLKHKSSLKGKETFLVYQTNGMGLKWAKQRIAKKLRRK